jgi:hypothetical protein
MAETDKTMWRPKRQTSNARMARSLQQRRELIAERLAQLKADIDSYNENQNEGEPITLCCDFTNDVEEAEAFHRLHAGD